MAPTDRKVLKATPAPESPPPEEPEPNPITEPRFDPGNMPSAAQESDAPEEIDPIAAAPRPSVAKRGPGRPKGARTGSGKTRRRPSGGGTASGAGRVTEVAGAIGRAGGTASSSPAIAKLEKRWTTFLAECLGYGSVLWVWYLTHDSDEISEEDRDDLELDDAEASSIAEPLGRILLRTQYIREHSEQILASSDYIAVAASLGAYAASTAPQLRAKRRRQAERAQLRRAQRGMAQPFQHQQPAPGAPNVPRHQDQPAPTGDDNGRIIEPPFIPRTEFTPGLQFNGD